MILVTSGHEKGIGLEVFLKSLLTTPRHSKKFCLYINEEVLKNYLNTYSLSFEIDPKSVTISGYLTLNCKFVGSNINPTMDSLKAALDDITTTDTLFTLPTSKDQIIWEGKQYNGYTEFLRNYYQNNKLLMSFIGPNENVVLLTDHIQLKEVVSNLNAEKVSDQVQVAQSFFKEIKKLGKTYILGLNPHAGENGLLGNDEELFSKVKNAIGPIPADTINLNQLNKNDLIVSAYHDQGLSFFKTKYKTMGINNTIGLDFRRVSLDHGTAFNLFGTHKANYSGCQFLINEITNW